MDKVEGKGLSANDFTDALLAKLNSLSNYTLPVGGELLGGVKNGGNVISSLDGSYVFQEGDQLLVFGNTEQLLAFTNKQK